MDTIVEHAFELGSPGLCQADPAAQFRLCRACRISLFCHLLSVHDGYMDNLFVASRNIVCVEITSS